jgi:NAD(P)-dependent dehydrogenase (short-subunit alcohol dehydrogenase family)
VIRSFVVTGAGRGIGRAIAEAIMASGDGVVAFDSDNATLEWARDHPAYERLRAVTGDASDADDCERAADVAGQLGQLSGWVNNAAVFRDEFLHESPEEVLAAIDVNVRLATIGSAVATRRFRDAGTRGSIVNISSHQGGRPVPGALPYATAKAAIEGLTRATAVDYGASGIRANALTLGTIRTERLEADLAAMTASARESRESELARLHPLGRIGEPADVASAVVYLLSDAAAFVSGAIIPIDGGRSAYGHDPEGRFPP